MLRWLFWLLFLPIWLPWRLLRTLLEKVAPVTAIELRLAGSLTDLPAPGARFGDSGIALLPLLSALHAAERDPKIRRVLVRIDAFSSGLGRAEELRDALARVRESGKEVIVLADHLQLSGYWVALSASRLILSPTGALDVAGIASQVTLFKGLLDKVGIEARLIAKGRYKSMREVFTETEISPANREMLESLVSDLYQQLEERIARDRHIERSEVRGVLDQGPFRAESALQHKLIDELGYEADVRAQCKQAKGFRVLSPERYLKRKRRRWVPVRPVRVAWLEVDGSIRMGRDNWGPGGKRSTGARSFLHALERIEEDKRVRAIVLRVNSPGGSALASDLMWHAVTRAKKERPLYVSMANVAASGGYYVSGVRGARIFANPSTLTGSIGVVGGKFEALGLYEKLGLGHAVVSIGKHATFHSPTSQWGEEELTKMQHDIDALYRDFVEKMAEGRGRDFAAIDAVAQGRVWTGAQAVAHGLVDELGGLQVVLAALRKELGLSDRAPLGWLISERPNLLQVIKSRFARPGLVSSAIIDVRDGSNGDVPSEHVWVRMPFDLRFH